jgi:biofilm PGA synthesis N-glycosyltransferase PgaC
MSAKYIVVTPVRNEAERLSQTIASMVAQTVRPHMWVLVNDGSEDDTPKIIDQAAKDHPWIKAVHRANRGFRKNGGGVVETFYDGFSKVKDEPWDFLVKLDGDLSFEPDYFEKCLKRFEADPKLGVGGGRIWGMVDGVAMEEATSDPAFHVRGATKMYRRATWDGIGGLLVAAGWDTLDEVKANMLGWRTYSFKELHVMQLKPTGSADGSWKNWFKNGRANYIVGYHPLFMLTKCAKRIFRAPVGLGAMGLFCGFFTSYFKRVPQVPDPEVIRYLRREQMNRLMFRPSLWSS